MQRGGTAALSGAGGGGCVMTRLAGAFLLAAACLGAGMLAAQRLRGRVRLLRQFEGALERMERELSYTATELPELLEKLSGPDGAGAFFRACAQGLRGPDRPPLRRLWHEGLRRLPVPLREGELELLEEAGHILGQYDSAGQCAALKRIRGELAVARRDAELERDRLTRVYCTVGGTAGLFLIILLS